MADDSQMMKIVEEQIDLHSMNKSYVQKSLDYMERNKVFTLKPSEIPRISQSKLIPNIFFGLGKRESLRKFRIGIVGTRKPDEYAVRAVTDIIRRYRNREIATVSGFAEGIDSLVHTASLENNIPTIGVLPGGFANIYPASNEKLRDEVKENGLLLTEYSPYIKAMKLNFIQRNHIIAAISDIVIITQGAMKSGTLSTLSHALKLQKQVYALPGEITNKLSYAPNYAIYRGAIPIYTKDLLPGISLKKHVKTKLTEEEEIVFQMVKKYRDINEMMKSNELPYAVTAATLTQLELKGLVMKGFNNKISVVED
ncbi:MAG: DNA-processing protein DprA [bacterium]